MFKALVIDPAKCTGCKQCELACSMEKEGVFNISKSRIRVFDFHEEAPLRAIYLYPVRRGLVPTGLSVNAITTTDDGVKIVHENLCVGCKVCTIACPFGTINYNATTGKVIKCDMCGGDPECAKICPTDAIVYADIEQAGHDRMPIGPGRPIPAPSPRA